VVAGIRDEQSTFGRYHQPPRQGDGRFGNAVAHPVLHRQEIIGAWRESDERRGRHEHSDLRKRQSQQSSTSHTEDRTVACHQPIPMRRCAHGLLGVLCRMLPLPVSRALQLLSR